MHSYLRRVFRGEWPSSCFCRLTVGKGARIPTRLEAGRGGEEKHPAPA
jgi:hypothetical protein